MSGCPTWSPKAGWSTVHRQRIRRPLTNISTWSLNSWSTLQSETISWKDQRSSGSSQASWKAVQQTSKNTRTSQSQKCTPSYAFPTASSNSPNTSPWSQSTNTWQIRSYSLITSILATKSWGNLWKLCSTIMSMSPNLSFRLLACSKLWRTWSRSLTLIMMAIRISGCMKASRRSVWRWRKTSMDSIRYSKTKCKPSSNTNAKTWQPSSKQPRPAQKCSPNIAVKAYSQKNAAITYQKGRP